MLRRFNKLVTDSGILKEWKEKSTYEKPSVRRRKAKKARLIYIREAQKERLQSLNSNSLGSKD